ncbi:LANO_0H14444g1_1 [Lachancea nothofagi CBS 11611]|uniref:Ribonuclease T2-like n=1 Tax=Lachancea nothofagi CBS 11611 TaxID=1266666 RepID=A0A1G4KMG0_9SACH|nr:LANO_0H14444g1_1 [Lachancea nothofagi CBS 11611]
MRIPLELLPLGGFSVLDRFLHTTDGTSPASCPSGLPLTCSNHTIIDDSCCFEYPGGVMMQTQFWDYSPPRGMESGHWSDELEKQLGPNTSFTNHGLWPDNCDGGYQQFCDNSRQIDDVYNLLKSKQFNHEGLEIQGEELLDRMSKLWKSNTGDHESLWIHEFNKHATCIKTLKPQCYARWDGDEAKVTDDYNKKGVYDYYRIAMKLYESLDSFKALEDNGITPSTTKSYTRDEISKALSSAFNGKKTFFKCDRNRGLNEIWYYHLLQGSFLGEEFHAIDAIGAYSNCPADGIMFYPKGYRPGSGGQPGRPGNGNRGTRGIIRVSGFQGSIIRNGHWMSGGTPANFDLIKAPFGNFHLKSRTGYCGPDNRHNNALVCNKGVGNAAQFEYDESKGYLGLSGSYEWYADEYPRGRQQSLVYAGHSEESKYPMKLKFVKLH